MYRRIVFLLIASVWLVPCGLARDKTKNRLPAYVLNARTVAVIIDPTAGMSIEDPQANRVAQKDVETALINWGRFEPVLATSTADLIIVVRKGSGRLMNQTMTDPRQNGRPGMIGPSENGASLGAQHGQQPSLSGDASSSSGPGQAAPHPQTEIGEADDSFLVYDGRVDKPLDNSPAWRYVAKDGLLPHTVPAVAEFRKAIADAEKAAAKTP
jgi:hypothetical protein